MYIFIINSLSLSLSLFFFIRFLWTRNEQKKVLAGCLHPVRASLSALSRPCGWGLQDVGPEVSRATRCALGATDSQISGVEMVIGLIQCAMIINDHQLSTLYSHGWIWRTSVMVVFLSLDGIRWKMVWCCRSGRCPGNSQRGIHILHLRMSRVIHIKKGKHLPRKFSQWRPGGSRRPPPLCSQPTVFHCAKLTPNASLPKWHRLTHSTTPTLTRQHGKTQIYWSGRERPQSCVMLFDGNWTVQTMILIYFDFDLINKFHCMSS